LDKEKLPIGWEKVKLKDISNIDKKALGINTPSDYEFSYISLSDVNSGKINKNLVKHKFNTAPSRARRIVSQYDILFSTVRPNLEGYAMIKNPVNNLIASTGFAIITPKEGQNTEYLYQFLYSYFIKKQIYSLVVGSNYPALNSADVGNLQMTIPKNPIEQKAIADLLAVWDKEIEKTEALIKAKEKQFGWLLRELISKPAKEEREGWQKVKLGNLAKISKKTPLESVDNETLLTVKLHCLGIEKNERIVPVLTKNGRPYYKRLMGEFLIGRQNFHNGGFGIVPPIFDGLIASNAITTLDIITEKILPMFLWFQFSERNYYKRIGHIMDGTGQKELSDKQILKLFVSIPDIEEQKEIVGNLEKAKQEIQLLKQLLDNYKKQKKGLLHQLLTGIWRIRV
jgi:type I restriction enzyme, S subunit